MNVRRCTVIDVHTLHARVCVCARRVNHGVPCKMDYNSIATKRWRDIKIFPINIVSGSTLHILSNTFPFIKLFKSLMRARNWRITPPSWLTSHSATTFLSLMCSSLNFLIFLSLSLSLSLSLKNWINLVWYFSLKYNFLDRSWKKNGNTKTDVTFIRLENIGSFHLSIICRKKFAKTCVF